MQKSTTNNILAILVSVGIHALLLLVPWQPAPVVELMPLEGSGVVELAELQQVKGEPDDATEQDALPQEAPLQPVTEAEVKKPEAVKPPQTAAQPSSKPIISIKPVVKDTVTQEAHELVTSPAGSVAVQTEPVDGPNAAEIPTDNQAQPQTGTEAQQEPEPVRPAYPGDDPTGEAMVASKRAVAYPKESQSSASEGDVIVEVKVGTDGQILSTGILSGPDDEWLKKNAELTILRYWTFKSAERAYKVVIEVSFRMQPVTRTEQRFISASFLD